MVSLSAATVSGPGSEASPMCRRVSTWLTPLWPRISPSVCRPTPLIWIGCSRRHVKHSPEGYEAYVGERGIRLSGGQRQRIGIARALYKQVSVLAFDEATSALDSATEQAVMDAIEGFNRNLTILIIAHRLTTLRGCDIIVELEQGRVVRQGSYQTLLESSPSFRQSVQHMVLSDMVSKDK